MRRRKLVLVLAGLVVAVCATGAFVLWPREDRITRENFERIKEGMSRIEVEAILGKAGDYTTGVDQCYVLGHTWKPWPSSRYLCPAAASTSIWAGDTAMIGVDFGTSGRAEDVSIFDPSKSPKQTPLENLLWRAKRQWRKWFPE